MDQRERRLRKHTEEMREAVVRAVLEEVFNARQVVELVAQGRLPPFEISPSTVNDLAPRAGKERDEVGDTDPAAEQLRNVARRTIERVEQLESPTDLSALREAHRVLQQADRADPRGVPGAAPTRRSEKLSDAAYASAFIAALADRDKAIGPGPFSCERPRPSWWPETPRSVTSAICRSRDGRASPTPTWSGSAR